MKGDNSVMTKAIEWEDISYQSSNRTVYTYPQLQIPGLKMFGKHTMLHAVAPLPDHYHKDCFEITFVTNGAISFSIQDIDYKLSGYDVFITKPDEVHSTNLAALSKGEIIWFQLDKKDVNNFLFLDSGAAANLLSRLSHLKQPLIQLEDKKLLAEIKTAFRLSKEAANKYDTANLLAYILYKLLDSANRPYSAYTPDMEKILSYIDQNLSSELTLEELSKYITLSTSQLKQKFKAQIGIAPRHYINMKKIEASKKMLTEGLSVTDTAMALGFNTSSYFSVVFRRYNACSPMEYCKKKKLHLPDYYQQ